MHTLPALRVYLLSLFLLLTGIAAAQVEKATDASDLVGTWRFLTTGDNEGYVSGNLKVEITEAGDTSCKLTVYQNEFGSAVEICSISVDGTDVVIVSETVVSSSVPGWRKEVFHLVLGDGEMTGSVKIVVDFPVRFTRRK